ncbi:uncharacterized protein [Penaeus vannamei]|uniref:uncharacterized protein n=1 Tax=Penaeus vannamei TaxID=6689 RepID=UPI00387F86DA
MNSEDENMAPNTVQALSGHGMLRISRSVNRFIGTKTVIKFGNWNVRRLRQERIIEKLVSNFQQYMCCDRDATVGTYRMNLEDGVSMLISAKRDGLHYQEGVMVSRNANKALSEWEPIEERLLYARFMSKHGNISILVCYTPTNNAPDDMKDDFTESIRNSRQA